MDIQILLFLQEFREGAGAFLADFLAKMTFLGEINSAIVIMAIVYWCFSKETGAYLLMGWAGSMHDDGFDFYQSVNGVWLTLKVPTRYLKRETITEKGV